MTFDPSVIGIEDRSGIYPSVTVFTLSNRILNVASNGDPFPALAGTPLSNTLERIFPKTGRFIRDQNYNFSFNYRAGRSTQNPQPTQDGAVGILANGVTFFGIKYDPRSLPFSNSQIPPSLTINPVFFDSFLQTDAAGGTVNLQGQYYYRSGKFLDSAWRTQKFISNRSYYNNSNFQGDNFRHPDGHSKILGYCFDGYPVYGPYGYRNPNLNSTSVIQMKSGYALRATDNHRPGNWKYNSKSIVVEGNSIIVGPGSFVEDYIYKSSRGTLDEFNGRFCVTPDYPQGTYAYFLTFEDTNLSRPAFPYIVGPQTKQTRSFVSLPDLTVTPSVDSLWTSPSGTTIAKIKESQPVGIKLPVNVRADTEVELISGSLPRGTELQGIQIVGNVSKVAVDTLSTFVLRARRGDQFEDRTYNIITLGADAPEWVTPEGLLPVGPENLLFILDSSVIDFGLTVTERDFPDGDTLEFFIAKDEGELPPGITLSRDGRLRGTTEPIIALDASIEATGYDTVPYASFPYDFEAESQQIRKLNRYYPFIVTVTDGIVFIKREFQIFVVTEDFIKENSSSVQLAFGVFVNSDAFLRNPFWLTSRNLGVKRADNNVTLYLEVLDRPEFDGVLTYTLEQSNDDSSPSILPPGTDLDSSNGIITGQIPYQPAITKNYKFTVTATRTKEDLEEVVPPATTKTFEVTVIGKIDGTIQWITPSNLGVIKPNIPSLLKVEASINIPDVPLLYQLVNGALPPGIQLTQSGELVGSIDADWDISAAPDRRFQFTIRARDRFGIAAIDRDFFVDILDTENELYTNVYSKPFLVEDQRSYFNNFVSNSNIFEPDKIYRVSDKNFGIQNSLQMLVFAGIEAKEIGEFAAAVTKNHRRKKYRLGEFKTAAARIPGTNDVIYEVVYIEVIDPDDTDKGDTRSQFTITSIDNNIENQVKYISNISNMRSRIRSIGQSDKQFLPLWMRAIQDDLRILGYVSAIPVCYCKPGTSQDILLNIKNSDFDVSVIDYELDRYIIERTEDSDQKQIILFPSDPANV